MAKDRGVRPSGSAPSPKDRRPNKPGGSAGRDSNRALARASTRGRFGDGGSGDGRATLVLWTGVFVVVAVAVIVVAITLVVSGGKSSTATGDVVAPTVVMPSNIPATGRTLGNPGAAVTVDLYGDFRCSACFGFTTGGTEQDLVDRLHRDRPGQAGLARLPFDRQDPGNRPLATPPTRPGAQPTRASSGHARLALCQRWVGHGGRLGVHTTRLSRIAKAAGLDTAQFEPCLTQAPTTPT